MSDVDEVAQEFGRDAPATVLVVGGHRHGPLIDTTDGARDGDVVTIIEGHPITGVNWRLYKAIWLAA